MEGILREVGLITSNEEAEAYGKALDEYLDRNKAANAKNREKKKKKVEKEKGGGGGSGHTYSLADYGLDEEEVQREEVPSKVGAGFGTWTGPTLRL